MSGRTPTPDDVDNYHRLCVEFGMDIHQSIIADMFKQFDFDFNKTQCILRGMAEDEDYIPNQIVDDDDFNEDDMNAYEDPTEEPLELPLEYITQQYISFGKICDDPEEKDPRTAASARAIMPNELNAIETRAPKSVLPKIDCVCRNWLQSGYCEKEDCPFLHTLYGVVCEKESCFDECCPFVNKSISSQYIQVREQLGKELRRPDEPMPKYAKAAWEAFEKAECPTLENLQKAFPDESFPEEIADVSLCVWPETETEDDVKVKQALMKVDKEAGEWKLIAEDSFCDEKIKYFGLVTLWSSKVPFIEMFRAYNNELEIHGRMRMFHLCAAMKSSGDEAKEHLRLARIHYNWERYFTRNSDVINLHMGNAHYGSFFDTNEHVLYLYNLSVTESRDLLNKLFTAPKRNSSKFFVFAMKSREEFFHHVTLDDIRKFCEAKGIKVTNHGDILEFVY